MIASSGRWLPPRRSGAVREADGEVLRLAGGVLRRAGARVEEFVLFGSGAVALWGVDLGRPMGDVDVFVAPALWRRLAELTVVRRLEVDAAHPPILEARLSGDRRVLHAFRRWRADDWWLDAGAAWRRAEEVGGWPVVRLEDVAAHKAGAIGWVAAVRGGSVVGTAQEKHVADLLAIARHLGRPATFDGVTSVPVVPMPDGAAERLSGRCAVRRREVEAILEPEALARLDAAADGGDDAARGR